MQRILIGFGLAILVSVPLGVLMGGFQAGQALFEPVVGLLRYLPASAFIPLLTIWLGIGEPSKVMLLFIGTVFFNTLMTADAVRQVPRALIDVSYTLGARRGEVLRKVVVPHALPGMIDAVRVNAAAAWNFVVVAELINSRGGPRLPDRPQPALPGQRPDLRRPDRDRGDRPGHRHPAAGAARPGRPVGLMTPARP